MKDHFRDAKGEREVTAGLAPAGVVKGGARGPAPGGRASASWAPAAGACGPRFQSPGLPVSFAATLGKLRKPWHPFSGVRSWKEALTSEVTLVFAGDDSAERDATPFPVSRRARACRLRPGGPDSSSSPPRCPAPPGSPWPARAAPAPPRRGRVLRSPHPWAGLWRPLLVTAGRPLSQH